MEGLHTEMFKMTEAVTPVRRDIWENLDHATQWLKKRLPGGSWDDRVFDAQTVSQKYTLSLPSPIQIKAFRRMVFAPSRRPFIQTNRASL